MLKKADALILYVDRLMDGCEYVEGVEGPHVPLLLPLFSSFSGSHPEPFRELKPGLDSNAPEYYHENDSND